ncbi:MAG: squalene synthase HpnC [Pseudomonadota bacterium]|jgi:hydroxysqualene synthase
MNEERLAHYENFPVASWLCPRHLREPITAIYLFARTADDVADEGEVEAEARLHALADMQNLLKACAHPHMDAFASLPINFQRLGLAIERFGLPIQLFTDLLDAFRLDVEMTQAGKTHPDARSVLGYCSKSANPIGRLLLQLYGITDDHSLNQSDDICTALQLANFWQDLSLDIPRGRHYLHDEQCLQHGVSRDMLLRQRDTAETQQLIRSCVATARATMLRGAPLTKIVPGRAGWELRLVVQGGLRILEKIETLQHATLSQRPKLGRWDVLVMAWRSLWM